MMANDFLRSFQALLAEKRDTHRCYIGFKSWQALGMPDGWYVWYGDGLVDATELREALSTSPEIGSCNQSEEPDVLDEDCCGGCPDECCSDTGASGPTTADARELPRCARRVQRLVEMAFLKEEHSGQDD